MHIQARKWWVTSVQALADNRHVTSCFNLCLWNYNKRQGISPNCRFMRLNWSWLRKPVHGLVAGWAMTVISLWTFERERDDVCTRCSRDLTFGSAGIPGADAYRYPDRIEWTSIWLIRFLLANTDLAIFRNWSGRLRMRQVSGEVVGIRFLFQMTLPPAWLDPSLFEKKKLAQIKAIQ